MAMKQVKEIRAERAMYGSGLEFVVIYDDMSAQKITFTGNELQDWNMTPDLFCKRLWELMHDKKMELHPAIQVLELELTSDDYKVEKLFAEMKQEVENEEKEADNGNKRTTTTKRTRTATKSGSKPKPAKSAR
jgi:hypothetical protein